MKWTIHKAATEFGVSRETIDRGLLRTGTKSKPGDTYTTKEIFTAIAGDFKFERTRRERATAEKLEMENARIKGETITLADNLAWQAKVLQPIRQRLNDLPGSMAHRVNPSDPTFAQRELGQWVKESLPILRSEIAKATKE
jgi:hypothetical protein